MGSRARRQRRGRPSLLEEGWVEHDPTGGGHDLTWTVTAPIGRFLALVGVGMSIREACVQAQVNRSTITHLLDAAKPWMPTDPVPSVILAIPEPHIRRLVAFAAAVEVRRGNPKAVGLTSLVQAAQKGDWRAGDRLLTRLYPDEFSNRMEVTGAAGGPVEVDAEVVAEKLGRMLRNMVDSEIADGEEVNLPVPGAEVNPELDVPPVVFPNDVPGATPGSAEEQAR